MTEQWNDNLPIYRQIRDRVARLIMDGTFPAGNAIPSVRAVASESQVNHLTVGKAYQELVDEGGAGNASRTRHVCKRWRS